MFYLSHAAQDRRAHLLYSGYRAQFFLYGSKVFSERELKSDVIAKKMELFESIRQVILI
jgi:hypothetical protein